MEIVEPHWPDVLDAWPADGRLACRMPDDLRGVLLRHLEWAALPTSEDHVVR